MQLLLKKQKNRYHYPCWRRNLCYHRRWFVWYSSVDSIMGNKLIILKIDLADVCTLGLLVLYLEMNLEYTQSIILGIKINVIITTSIAIGQTCFIPNHAITLTQELKRAITIWRWPRKISVIKNECVMFEMCSSKWGEYYTGYACPAKLICWRIMR